MKTECIRSTNSMTMRVMLENSKVADELSFAPIYSLTSKHVIFITISCLFFSFQVQALYDFDAQPGTGELSIKEGEILTVSRQDVGEGWWEGTNSQGQAGLFPAAYVKVSPLLPCYYCAVLF